MDSTRARTVFFVDDEPQVRKAVGQTLSQLENCRVQCFGDAGSCLKELKRSDCDLLITDVNMPKMDSLTLLEEAKRIRPDVEILLVTGYGDVPMAVKAVKAGALDFIEKPLNEATFLPVVKAALRKSGFDNESTKNSGGHHPHYSGDC